MHLFLNWVFFSVFGCFTGSRVFPILKLEEKLSKIYSYVHSNLASTASLSVTWNPLGADSILSSLAFWPFDSSFHFCFVCSCPVSHSVFNHSLFLKYSSGEMLGFVNSGLQLDHALPWRICLQPCLLPSGHRLPRHRGWGQHDPSVEHFVCEQRLWC